MTDAMTKLACPSWCDQTCGPEPDGPNEPLEPLHGVDLATIYAEPMGQNPPPKLSVQLIALHGRPAKVVLGSGDYWLSLGTARALAAELLRAVELAGRP